MIKSRSAVKECVNEYIPRGYSKDDGLAWEELQCYLRFCGYGLGYLIGKLQIEQLIAEYLSVDEPARAVCERAIDGMNLAMSDLSP